MIRYICSNPKCCIFTEEMELLTQFRYIPTERQEQERPDIEHIKHELLLCPCGKLNNWYDLYEV